MPALLYMHGGGWVLGSWITHDLLTRWLAVGANAAVVFVEYSRAPEAKYPVQIEQFYAAAQWITRQGAGGGFDITRIAVAGDSAGGNMSTVLALMAKQRGSVQFVHQSLYYPMTDANAEDSESLRRFKDGPYGSVEGLAWFWNRYLTVEESRSDILVSPLQGHARRPGGGAATVLSANQHERARAVGCHVSLSQPDGLARFRSEFCRNLRRQCVGNRVSVCSGLCGDGRQIGVVARLGCDPGTSVRKHAGPFSE